MTRRELGLFLVVLGASSFAMGCSEAVPPANQGAVSVNFSTASTVGTPGSCTLAPHDFQIGVVHPSDAGQILFSKDGEARAQVFCSVVNDGSAWNAAGEMEEGSGAKSFRFSVNNLSPANDRDNPAMGAVTYRSVDTVDFFRSTGDTPCTFWINDQQEVSDGLIWAQYSCPLIEANGKECSIGESTVAMQNCDS
jgi:hypothetical protein